MRWKPPKRWALSGSAAVGVGLAWTAATAQSGCFTHNCDPSSMTWDGGRITPDNTYETNAIDEPWLDYRGNRTIHVHYPTDMGDKGWSIVPSAYVVDSQGANVVSPDGTWDPKVTMVEAAGQLAEFSNFSSQGFDVLNATCANYFARFTVHFETLGAGADAGADAAADAETE